MSAAAQNSVFDIEDVQSNFHWWEGVVEDNLDPLGIGRCKVRVIAHNPTDKSDATGVTTQELPWAYPMMPLNNPHGKIVAMKPGTRVFGCFRDGNSKQNLLMMGTVNIGYDNPGQPYNYDENIVRLHQNDIALSEQPGRIGTEGFIDDRAGTGGVIETQPKKSMVTVNPVGKLQQEDITDYGPLEPNEVNTPRLQRGINKGTITASHAIARDVVITPAPVESKTTDHPLVSYKERGQSGSLSGTLAQEWLVEPKSPFAARYPFNSVEESDSGHLREIDDTPGAERIKETHRMGTFYEIHPDGSKVTKIVKNNFEVTIGDDFTKIEGRCAIHVNGQADFYCLEDINVKTEKNAVVTAAESATVDAGTDIHAVARTGSATVSAGTTAIVRAGTDATVEAGNDATLRAENNISVIAEGNLDLSCNGPMTFKDNSATAVNVDELQKDIVDRQGGARIRVDDQS